MEKVTFRFISQEDILALNIPYEEVIDAVEKVMSEFSNGTCQLPVKIHVNSRPQTYVNAMPAYVGGENEAQGMKWVAGYPENRQKGLPVTWGVMVMNDCNTGGVQAIMDARWITAIRTAAVAAVTAISTLEIGVRCTGNVDYTTALDGNACISAVFSV